MNAIPWLMLVAALLPIIAAALAKGRGEDYDNEAPRPWLARQSGWRARANAAQSNIFEGLPFFYGAVLFALYADADPAYLSKLMLAWIAARVAYIGVYVGGYGSVRSFIWTVCLVLNIAILFAAT